ncbi:hypothetical protein NXY07_26445 [Phocaeicola dorei]|nr:hypothetical protein [Phocaeicola dorei]
MDVSIEKLERLMNELKDELINPNEDKAKRQSLVLIVCNGHRPTKKHFNLKEYNQKLTL